MSVFRQALSSVIICCQMLCLSLFYVWPSSTVTAFHSEDTPLNRPMSDMEINFFGSIFPIVALIATPIPSYLIDVLGRKNTCILLAIPQVIAWTIICYCEKVEWILTATCIGGLIGCQVVVVPLYVAEICQENIRGTLTAGTPIFANIGNVVSYAIGGYLSYRTMNYIALTITIISVALLTFLKESPIFLMKKNLEKEAAQSIAFYRSLRVTDKEVTKEINALRNIINPVLDDSPEEEQLNPNVNNRKDLTLFQFIKKSKSTRRGLYMVLSLLLLTNMQGMPVVLVYSKPILQEAMPSISATVTSIALALVGLASGLFGAYMLDVVGRRVILISASAVTCLSCLAIGTQIQLTWGPSWINALFMLVYCISYSLGPGLVPMVLMAEVFLPKIKGVLTLLSIEWVFIVMFTQLFIFNPIVKSLGLGFIFYFFALAAFVTAVYGYYRLIETKGITVEAIQTKLYKKNKTVLYKSQTL